MTTPRDVLKDYFKTNAIPTEGQFAELIDTALNQADDGIFKETGQPLGIVAAATPLKPVLKLYAEFKSSENSSPDWMICLNAKDPRDETKNATGFGIVNGAGETKLMIGADGSLFLRGRMHADSLRIGNDLIIANGNISGANDVAAASATLGPVTISGVAGLRVGEPGMTITSRLGLVVEGPVTVGNVAINDRTIDGVGWLGAGSAKIGGVSIADGTITTGASSIGADSATIGKVTLNDGIVAGLTELRLRSGIITGSPGSSAKFGDLLINAMGISGADEISTAKLTLGNAHFTCTGRHLSIALGEAQLEFYEDGSLKLVVPETNEYFGYSVDVLKAVEKVNPPAKRPKDDRGR